MHTLIALFGSSLKDLFKAKDFIKQSSKELSVKCFMYDKYLSDSGCLGRSTGISVTSTKERTVSENQRGMPLPSFQGS